MPNQPIELPDDFHIFSKHGSKQKELRSFYLGKYTEAFNYIDGHITTCISVLKHSKVDTKFIKNYIEINRADKRLEDLKEELIKLNDDKLINIFNEFYGNYKTLLKFRTHLTHNNISRQLATKRINANSLFLINENTRKEIILPITDLDSVINKFNDENWGSINLIWSHVQLLRKP
jgi:hypothetical protein